MSDCTFPNCDCLGPNCPDARARLLLHRELPARPARHPLSERFHEILAELGRLHDAKQADYGRDDDPFANVRGADEWDVPGWVGAMIRATDKVRRLQTLRWRGVLRNESAIDAFNDLAVYAVIGRVLFETEGATLDDDLHSRRVDG